MQTSLNLIANSNSEHAQEHCVVLAGVSRIDTLRKRAKKEEGLVYENSFKHIETFLIMA
jgi:hypothetical protein